MSKSESTLSPADWKKVFEVKFLELGEGGTLADRRRLAIQVIASAMAAERERCARIAEQIGDGQTDLHYVVGRQIAAKIRSGE